ncbi:MAG: opacity protein-like surface antigen [Paraglaciecola sp.]|jgi:opacity protein-like surface antigen
MRLIKLTLLAIMCPMFLFAQNTQVGIFAGLSNYQGDLVESSFTLKESSVTFGALLKHDLSTKLAIRAGLNFGKLKGDDANFSERENRGYRFETNFFDLSAGLEYTPLAKERYDAGGTFQKTISPFAYIGVGIVNADVSVDDNIVRTQDELDASSLHFALPIGLGIKADLTERIALAADLSFRATFSDYLDGFSESAGIDKSDWYWLGGLTLTYRLGESNENSVGN